MRFADLHTYQESCIDFGLEHMRIALFLGLGLGKTVISLTVAAIEMGMGRARKTLVIAPLRVANNVWTTEAQSWSHLQHLRFSIATGSIKQRRKALGRDDADVYVITQDNVDWLMRNFPRSKWKWDIVIVDESSGFKSPQANRTKALSNILRNKTYKKQGVTYLRRSAARRVMLLSATPATNGLSGLWSQISMLDSGERLGRSMTAYMKRYFHKSVGGGEYAKPVPNDGAKEKIYEKIRDITYVMRPEDYLDMPELIYRDIPVEIDFDTRREYKELEREFLLELPEQDAEIFAVNSGALANKLLQFANGACYTGETPEKRDPNRQYAVMHDAKIDALREIVSAAEGSENLLVAYYYQSDLKRLTEAFPQAVVMDKAGTPIRAWNAGKIPILLCHPESAGKGLNLQHGGCTIVFFSLLWSLEAYQQFIGRLYRQGQKFSVTVNHLIVNGTIEKRVAWLLRSNAETQDDFLDALKQTPDTELRQAA